MVARKRAETEGIETVARNLRDRIHRGVLVPGQRLIEADLMSSLGVSRARVREVLRRLEAEGLVQIDRNRGASVRRITRRELSDTLEVLGAISFLLVRKAVARVDSPEVRNMLEASLERVLHFRSQLSDLVPSRQYMNEHARFWDVLAAVCENPVLAETRTMLETKLFRLALDNAPVAAGKNHWAARHEEMLRAILAGDGDEAIRFADESLRLVEAAILALPDTVFE